MFEEKRKVVTVFQRNFVGWKNWENGELLKGHYEIPQQTDGYQQ